MPGGWGGVTERRGQLLLRFFVKLWATSKELFRRKQVAADNMDPLSPGTLLLGLFGFSI